MITAAVFDTKPYDRELNFSLNGLVGFDLHGKTAGIVGTGKIGRIVAQILRGFGMRVLAYDPFPNRDWAAQQGVEYVDASALSGRSDVMSLLLTFPNVLITSHQAFLTREALSDIARTTIANLEALAAGQSFIEGSVLT